MPRYAISDIHGCPKTFDRALKAINLSKNDELFLLGDYIDRGPDSLGVIERIWGLEATGHQVRPLRGNHEQMLIDYMVGLSPLYEWAPPQHLWDKTLNWLNKLAYYQQTPGYLLVHAGVDLLHPEPLTDLHAMLWLRYWYKDFNRELARKHLDDAIIIHGHTPVPQTATQTMIDAMEEYRIVDIDSGCAYGADDEDTEGRGVLTVLNLDDQKGLFIKYSE